MTRVDQLKETRLNGSLADKWDFYCSQIDRLAELYDTERRDDFRSYMNKWRQTVATMLDLFESME